MAAAAADTLISPNPVARSWPGVAGLLKRGWQRPTRTSTAVLARAWATWAGVRASAKSRVPGATCGSGADHGLRAGTDSCRRMRVLKPSPTVRARTRDGIFPARASSDQAPVALPADLPTHLTATLIDDLAAGRMASMSSL